MNDELELKYVARDLAALQGWLDEHIFEGPDGWHEQKISDRYFDTADGALARAGYGARLRRLGGQTILGLKADRGVRAGVHRRLELEAEASPALDPGRWPPIRPRALVRRVADGRALHERFVLRQQRRTRDWSTDGARCQFALDALEVSKGTRKLGRLDQLEVELQEGNEEALLQLAERLTTCRLLVPEPRSKMVIAAEMVDALAPLAADEPFAEAGRRVLRGHLQRMLEREGPMRAGDGLALKQMRVAARRMRATWRLFEGAYQPATERRYVRELRLVARRLGKVRDLDVLLDQLPPEPALAALAEHWRARRQAAWLKLMETLDSDDYQTFVADYRRFTETAGQANGAQAGLRVRDAAGSRLWAAYETVRAYQPGLAQTEVATLHALRVEGKRLRYALETFAPVLPRRSAKELLARLTRLQDHLGALNDADVARQASAEWLLKAGRAAPARARRAARLYEISREDEVERLRGSFGPAWRPVGGAGFGRTLATALGSI
ncbi:inorganic triphosphatase [soil metagenome]